MKDRQPLSVPVTTMPSFTTAGKEYTLTVHGYVTCSCMSAANPVPGQRRYGQCKHTDAFESQYRERTRRRTEIVDQIKALRDQLRQLDGGDGQ